MNSSPIPMVDLDRLSKTFSSKKGDLTVVKDFNLRIGGGEFITLIGHSGCGKSTVLSMVAGLSDLSSGNIIIDGQESTEPGPDRGIVFQSPCLLPWMTALDNVLLGVNRAYFTASKAERRAVAEYYLQLVGLGDSMKRYPSEISQGMRQRVGIARAFALQPKMLLLDEPFGMLDALTRIELQDILLKLWRDNRVTTLMVTHDVDEAIYLSDRVVMMTNGPEAEVGEIVAIPFDRPRTRAAVMTDPRFDEIKAHLLGFLNERSHLRPSHQPEALRPQFADAREPAASPKHTYLPSSALLNH